jgi:CBS domain-containing membrane protein
LDKSLQSLRRFLPQPNTVPRAERMRAVAGAFLGLLLVGGLSVAITGHPGVQAALVAPMGASAVLVFCVPGSPLAQPWSVIGGNTIAAIIGVACFHSIANPLLAAPLAGCLAILVMFLLRCLHPPSGAVALTAVLGAPAVHAAGFGFAFVPVALNSVLIVLVALVFNNLTGRRYPVRQKSALTNTHSTSDPVPTARVGFTKEDLDAALARYGQVLDVSRADLEKILRETEMNAYGRRFGVVTCGEIMSRDAVTIEPSTPLAVAWRLLRHHRVHYLPVLRRDRRVVGILGQSDFLHHAGLDEYRSVGERLRELAGHLVGYRSDRPETAAQIMTTAVKTIRVDAPIAALVPLMSNGGLHDIPVVDEQGIFVGIVSQSDLLAALYDARLSQGGAAVGDAAEAVA